MTPLGLSENTRRRAIFLVIGIGSFMGAVDSALTNIIVPVIQKDLATSLPAVQWVALVFLVTTSALLPVCGRLGDLWGHRSLYLAGIIVFTISSFLCSLAPSVGWLIGFRSLQAAGSAMLIAVAPAILTMNFPPENRGRVLGMQLTMTYLGLITGPTLGGFVTHFWHWRAAFLINVPIGLMLFAATLWVVPRTGGGKREGFDLGGGVLLFAAIMAVLLGITGDHAAEAEWKILLALAGLVCGFLFVRREVVRERREEPLLLSMSLFRDRTFSLSAGVCLAGYTCEFFIAFLIPFYVMRVLGLSIGVAGLLMTAKSVLMVFVAPVSGNLSDRLGARPLSLASMACYMLSFFLQAELTATSSMLAVVIPLVLAGIAAGLFVSPNNSTMLGAAPRGAQGVASAILGLVRNLGMSFGIAFSGVLLAFRAASLLEGFQFAMAWGIAIAGLGFILSAVQKRTVRPAREPAQH